MKGEAWSVCEQDDVVVPFLYCRVFTWARLERATYAETEWGIGMTRLDGEQLLGLYSAKRDRRQSIRSSRDCSRLTCV